MQWLRPHQVDGQQLDEVITFLGRRRMGATEQNYGRKYTPFSCCFPCGVPQGICQRFEASPHGGWRQVAGIKCQFPGVVIPTVVSIMHLDPGGCSEPVYQCMEADGVDRDQDEQVYTWFGQKVR
jgi:hypothetical protein